MFRFVEFAATQRSLSGFKKLLRICRSHRTRRSRYALRMELQGQKEDH
jgi:hypothetical protein